MSYPVRRVLNSLNAGRLLASALSIAAMNAHAVTALTATEIIQHFNVVTLGDYTMTNNWAPNHVEGLTFVGGSLIGPTQQYQYGEPNQHNAANYAGFAGLTVLGDASKVRVQGGATVLGNFTDSEVQNGNSVYGTASNVSFNGGGSYYALGTSTGTWNATDAQARKDTALATNFSAVLNGASDAYKALASTGSSVSYNGFGKLTFNAVAGSNGVAVFDLAGLSSALTSATEFEFVLGSGVTSVILNSNLVTGTLHANFVASSDAKSIGSKLLWNFYDATSLTFTSAFGGSILATDASISNPGGGSNLEGGVFVKSITQGSEIHLNAFVGTVPTTVTAVPEPSTWLLLALGLTALSLYGRRSKRQPH